MMTNEVECKVGYEPRKQGSTERDTTTAHNSNNFHPTIFWTGEKFRTIKFLKIVSSCCCFSTTCIWFLLTHEEKGRRERERKIENQGVQKNHISFDSVHFRAALLDEFFDS